ncbi:MAG TPA: SDR family oxidoreductase [Nocardioidaceae bacterium]|nr:SDR family oxidoreductase [Nocardioidaceae bacterium]
MSGASATAVVSGATGGIGAAMVSRLAGEGYGVLALGRDDAALAEVARSDPRVTTARVDLTDAGSLDDALPELDRVDALVHCAGIAEVAPVEGSDVELWRRTFEVNLVAAAELTRALLPPLRAAHGHVIFVNAAYGMTGVPRWSAYVGSKVATRELAESLRAEEAPHGLRVTSIYPAGVRTPLLRRVRTAFDRGYDPTRGLSPESLATVMLSVLRAPNDAHVTDLAIKPAPDGSG